MVTDGTNEENMKKTLILTVFFDQIQQSCQYRCKIILIYNLFKLILSMAHPDFIHS